MPSIAPSTVEVGRSVLSTLSSNISNENGTAVTPSDETNVLVGIVVEIIILVLISGNLLMILTLVHYKPWSIADLLLFSLSLSDFINGAIPVHILNIVNSFRGQNAWSSELCSAFTWMTFSLRMISVFTITLISGERMLMLTRPLHHHSVITIEKARLAVAGVWAAAMFIAILPFIGAGKSGFENGYCFYQLYNLGIAYGYIIEAIGIIQLVLVLACFIAIRLSSGEFIKRQSVMAAAHQTGGKDTQLKKQETAGIKQVKQLSKLMGIVVILYYISWLPYLLKNLVGLAHGRSLSHTVEVIIGFFSLISAIINPVLYGKMSLRYWRGYQFIFRKIRSICGGEEPDGQFFDGKRRGSQATAYSVQSYNAAKRGSLASINRVDEKHVNAAFVEDEQNHNQRLKHLSPHREEEDDDDSDDNTGGIMICPMEELSKTVPLMAANDDDDNDDNDETQISICPFEESLQIGQANDPESEAKNSKQMEEQTVNDAHEDDITICPLTESILAHFEDIQKLVSEEDSEDGNNSNGSNKSESLTEKKNEGLPDSINKLEFQETKTIMAGNNSKTNKGFTEDEVKDNGSNSSDNDEDITDLLGEDNKSSSPSQGHFFVDDVVKLLQEDEELKSQISNKNSYELLPEGFKDGKGKGNDIKATSSKEIAGQKSNEKVGEKGDKKDEINKGRNSVSQDEMEGLQVKMKKQESKINEEKDYENEGDEDDEEEDDEDQEEEKEEEEEGEEEEEAEAEAEEERESRSESEDEHEQEGTEKEKGEETDEDSMKDEDDSNQPRRKLSNLEMDGYSGKITCLKNDNSKRKYTRSVSDLLRKELGEI